MGKIELKYNKRLLKYDTYGLFFSQDPSNKVVLK